MEGELELDAASGEAGLSASFIVIAVILSTIVVCTFVGNLFVIVAILVDKNLQTTANQLVLSLAVADLMVACLVMPLGAYNDIHQGWWLGTGVCEFWTSADVLCCTASILNLLAIALDRYWAVTNVDYIYKRTRRRVSLMILCAWTVGAVVSLAPIFGWKDPDFARRVLEEHKCLVSQDVAYQIFATISTFYSPLVLLLALYWRIFQVARKRIHCKPGGKAAAQSLAAPSTKKLASSMGAAGVVTSISSLLAPPNGRLKMPPEADASNEITSGAATATDLIKHPAGIGHAREPQAGLNGSAPRNCLLETVGSSNAKVLSCSTTIIMKPPQATSDTMTNEAKCGAGQAAPDWPQRVHSNNVAPERLLDVARLPTQAGSRPQTCVGPKMTHESNEPAPSDGRQNEEELTTITTGSSARHQLPLLADLHRQTSMESGRLHPAEARVMPPPPEVAPLAECVASSIQSLSECQCCYCYLHATNTSDEEDDERSKTPGSTLSCGSAAKWPQTGPHAHLHADDDKLPLPRNIFAQAAPAGACPVGLHRQHRHSSAYSSSAGSASSSSSTTKSMLAAAAVAELDDSLGFLEQRLQQRQLAQISLAKLVTQSSLTSACVDVEAENKFSENKPTSNEPCQPIDKQIESGNSLRAEPSDCNGATEDQQKIKAKVNEGVRHLSRTVTLPSSEQSFCAAQASTLSVSIRRRFKALGKMVSFVQTSRQFNSSSSAPTSQSDHEEDDDEGSPEQHSARSLDEEQQQVGFSPENSMGASGPTPARALNNLQEGDMRAGQANKHVERQDSKLRMAERAADSLAAAVIGSCDQQSKLKVALGHPLPVGASPTVGARQQTRRQNLEVKREKKAAKTLAIITGVFVCCWLPFFVNAILMPICGLACTPSDLILSVLLWLGYLNSLLNPIIYTIFSPDFRRAFRRLLCWPSSSNANTPGLRIGAKLRGHRGGALT